MQIFDCVVRLGGGIGSHDTEVPLTGVTASEVVALKMEHGDDGVVGLVLRSVAQVDAAEEYDRLARKYARGDERRERFESVFGPAVAPRIVEKLAGYEEADVVPVDPDALKKQLRAELKRLGVPTSPNAGVETLQAMLDEHMNKQP